MKKKSKQENPRRSILLFLAVIVGSMLVGGILGGLVSSQQGNVQEIIKTALGWIQKWSGWAAIAVTVIGLSVSIAMYIQCRKEAKLWDGEDEAYIEKLENKLSMGQIILTVSMILIFSFNAMSLSKLLQMADAEIWGFSALIADLFVVLAVLLVMQQKYVGLAKQINPEKRGNTFDLNFRKTWMKSCDEQERMIIYKSSYRSFQVMQSVFPICWGILLMLSIAMDIGIIPFLILGILWLIQTTVYYAESMKAYKKK